MWFLSKERILLTGPIFDSTSPYCGTAAALLASLVCFRKDQLRPKLHELFREEAERFQTSLWIDKPKRFRLILTEP